jgi:hypothetical protein
MSRLNVNTLQGPSNIVRVAYPNRLYAPGHIIQVAHTVSQERIYYQLSNQDGGQRSAYGENWYDGGRVISQLNVTITPTSVDSYIFVEFNVFFECPNDVVFTIARDFNTVGSSFDQISALNMGKWMGAGSGRYDNNNSSTPSYINLPWIDRPGTLEPVTYMFVGKSSNSSDQAFTLNSTLTDYQNGSDNCEQGVSFSIAQEIAY